MTQEHSSEFLLATPGIQHRVTRRTILEHTVPQIMDSLRDETSSALNVREQVGNVEE